MTDRRGERQITMHAFTGLNGKECPDCGRPQAHPCHGRLSGPLADDPLFRDVRDRMVK